MTHATIIFLGPSLPLEQAKTILPDAFYLPPIQCGDLLNCFQYQPQRIGIIDGYFEHCATVWHKEILLALDRGITVYGAASMGALRAAELTEFGMIGVGHIFKDFYHGVLEDDDEVAVVHRPDKSDYESFTDAMVNIRATLQKAVQEKIINPTVAEKIIYYAKVEFYKERSLEKAIDRCESTETQLLKAWLSQGNFVDQKKLDAIELLETIKKDVSRVVVQQWVDPIVLNTTILLRRLNDRHQCESLENSQQAQLEKQYPGITRYSKLLAYLLKTRDRLRPLHKGKLDDNIFTDSPSVIW